MYASSSMRTMSESLSSYRRSTLARMPSQVASAFFFLPLPPPASPLRRQSRTDAGRSPHGVLRSNLNCLARVGSTTFRRYPDGSPHGNTTPSRIEIRGSPSTSSSLTRRRVPSPPQVGQAPNGELNEKWRGSSSGIEIPQTGQPYFSENVSTF